jgi:hypothetical protein
MRLRGHVPGAYTTTNTTTNTTANGPRKFNPTNTNTTMFPIQMFRPNV